MATTQPISHRKPRAGRVAVMEGEVMVRRLVGYFVIPLPPDPYGYDQAHLAQETQVAVDRRPVHVGDPGAHALVDLIRRGVPLPLTNSVQDQLALRGYPEPPRVHERGVIPMLMRHGPSRSCKYFQHPL